jgi:hypothetical protein
MKGFYGLYVMAGMLLCCSFAGAENIAVSLVTPSAAYMDHFVAIEKGYFREQNLNVEYIRAGGGVATPALMSGELHLSTSAGSALRRGSARRTAENRLHQSLPTELQVHFDEAGDPNAQSIVKKIYAELKASGWQPKP